MAVLSQASLNMAHAEQVYFSSNRKVIMIFRRFCQKFSVMSRRDSGVLCMKFILLLLGIFSQSVYSQSFSKLWGSATYFGRYHELLYMVEPQIRLIDRSKK